MALLPCSIAAPEVQSQMAVQPLPCWSLLSKRSKKTPQIARIGASRCTLCHIPNHHLLHHQCPHRHRHHLRHHPTSTTTIIIRVGFKPKQI